MALKVRKRVLQITEGKLSLEVVEAKLKKYRAQFEQAQRFVLQTLSKASKKLNTLSHCKWGRCNHLV